MKRLKTIPLSVNDHRKLFYEIFTARNRQNGRRNRRKIPAFRKIQNIEQKFFLPAR